MGGGGGPGGGGPGGPGGGGDFSLVLLDMPKPGAHVKPGDVVAAFDRESMLNRIEDYKDAVVQSELNIKNRKATLAVNDEAHKQQVASAKAAMDKAQLDLKTIEVIPEIDAEKYKLAAEETAAHYKQLLTEVPLLATSQKADLRNTEISLETAKLELQKAVTNADKMVLKSPMDGIIVMQAIRRGLEFAQVAKGDQVFGGQSFMQVVDPSSMVVNANVNQVDAEILRIGMKATVRLDAYPGLELPAHVYSIGAVTVAGRRPNFMRQIPVRFKLDKTDPRVLPDLSASAEVVLDSATQATIAPLGSVFEDSAKPYVYVQTADGWRKREVELGLRSNVSVAVRSGLTKGEVVALDAPVQAADASGAGSKPAS
jgi:multidrug resistance efflux pump